MKQKVIIMGAAGRDFHNFNIFFRNNKNYDVVCFTATQIPNIDGRVYPPELAGKLYPHGIPIYPEEQLTQLIKKYSVNLVVFAYSDVSHEYVMHKASEALAAGADFMLLGNSAVIKSKKPVISVCAVRTGAGKSPLVRWIAKILKKKFRVGAIRHPMPYGDLKSQAVQKFRTYDDIEKNKCTIEEIEEYEHLINAGITVYAGVDYERILKLAEKECDIIIWDGGNNDTPFIKPDVKIVVADPLRAGHELKYHPGETNIRMADVVVINKTNTASEKDVKTVENNVKILNKNAKIVKAELKVTVDENIRGKKVICVEDGPTITHGGMEFGAAYIAAKKYKCRVVDPRKSAVGSIRKVFEKYPDIKVLPAMGYSEKQAKELQKTINRSDADLVLTGTPIDISRVLNVSKPVVRVKYEFKEKGKKLEKLIMEKF